MLRGTIKKKVEDRGFGFIVQENKGPDVFFHLSVVDENGFDGLYEGQSVSFEMVQGEKGPKATRVSPG